MKQGLLFDLPDPQDFDERNCYDAFQNMLSFHIEGGCTGPDAVKFYSELTGIDAMPLSFLPAPKKEKRKETST